jgi:anaerobic ribonucleoside-triphosphate reductase activating protein
MLIHNKIDNSSVNGPGDRAVIWVQGCTLGCKGCWNQETHAFSSSTQTSIYSLVDWILGISDIEGVTFSGGEPMQQAPWLFVLMTEIRRVRPELSFGMYTGYTENELDSGRYKWLSEVDGEWQSGTRELWMQIKSLLDFAIMGRYNQLVQTKDLPLRGSSNQSVVFFSQRYSEADLKPQEVEMTIDESGLIQITGFPVGITI